MLLNALSMRSSYIQQEVYDEVTENLCVRLPNCLNYLVHLHNEGVRKRRAMAEDYEQACIFANATRQYVRRRLERKLSGDALSDSDGAAAGQH